MAITSRSRPRRPRTQVVLTAAWTGAVVAALALALVGPVPGAILLAIAGHAVGIALVMALMRRGYPHADLGLCNQVTLVRLALTAVLLAPLVAPTSGWTVICVALVVLALDGVDGWLARRQGQVSTFGARLDVEVDAALSLVLALNAWASGTIGIGVLLLALPRYVYVAAALVVPWMARPLLERFDRKLICVVQIAVLIALQAPVVEGLLAITMATGTALALSWSFGRDALWLWRTRGRASCL